MADRLSYRMMQTLRDLCRGHGAYTSGTNTTMGALEDRGLVRRERSGDPPPGRTLKTMVWVPTDAGRKMAGIDTPPATSNG